MRDVEHPVALALERSEPGDDGAVIHQWCGFLLVEEPRVDDVVRSFDEDVAFVYYHVAVLVVG